MISYITSGLAIVTLMIVMIFGALIFSTLRIKGDVFAEFIHAKTTLRFDARDRRNKGRLR